jgi:hypothetical protein
MTKKGIVLRHRNLLGAGVAGPCYMCRGSSDPCTSGHASGYATCKDCHDSTGPSQRNCLPCYVPEFLLSRDRRGFAPFFALVGDLAVTGRLVDPVTRKARRGVEVRLAFPNGLFVSATTGPTGAFRLVVRASEPRKPAGRIDLGTRPYRSTESGAFALGLKLDAPTRVVKRPLRGAK